MRLIDADLLLEAIEKRSDCEPTHFRVFKRIMKIVGEMPTEDTVKHGRWVIRKPYVACSRCDHRLFVKGYGFVSEISAPSWKYCPACGAYMDGKE